MMGGDTETMKGGMGYKEKTGTDLCPSGSALFVITASMAFRAAGAKNVSPHWAGRDV